MNPLSFQLLATLNSSLHCAGVCSPKMLPTAISALDPGPGLRRWSVFWPFVTLCHLVTLCDTLWQCNTVTGGVLRKHRVVTGHLAPRGGSSGVRAATSHDSHNPTLALGHFIILLHCHDPSEYSLGIQSTGDNGRMENVNCYSRFNMKTGNLSLLKYFTCRTSIIFW